MTEMIRCPSCGYSLEAQAPMCGNCGQDLRGSQVDPTRLPTSGYSGPPKGILSLILFLVIAAGAFFFYREDVEDLFKNIEDAFDQSSDDFESPEIDITFSPFDSEFGALDFVEGARFERVRQLTDAINAGGLTCREVKVDHQDEYISTGSCQAGGVHVQINIYLYRPSLRGANGILRTSPIATVHDENWWVITQAPVAREIHGILGGRLRTP